MNRRYLFLIFVVGILGASLSAQQPAPGTPRALSPIDLTGNWVSIVTEDWRFRMVTPPKGDYASVPLNGAARQVADKWDPAADEAAGNACKSYGAGNIMSVPGRLHITWQDADTLKIETDAGTQTRLFHFTPRAVSSTSSQAPRSWQGESAATWEPAPGPDGGGSLRVVTTNLRPGYLRKNGVPYGERATVTENFDLAPLAGNGKLLLVTTIVDDPVYLTAPYVVSPHFKKEPDGSKWDPTPCSSTW